MLMQRWKFTPRIWPTLAALTVIPILLALGQWQLSRAAEKQHSHDQYLQRSAASALVLDTRIDQASNLSAMHYRRIEARGHYAAGRHILLDNQVHEGTAGYLVYTPFQIGDQGVYILINRGWVATGPDRSAVPVIDTPTGTLVLSGIAALPPPPGIKLGENMPEQVAPGIVRVQRVELVQMAAEYGGKLLPYELRLDADQDSGFTRAWRVPGSGHERHLGYAFQWFAMAAVVLILYICLNLRREPRQP